MVVMLLELISRIAAFDINWLISLVTNNLFFVFAFIALMHYFMEGKKVIFATVIISLVLFAVQDFESVANVVIIVPGFLLFHYIGKIVVHILAETTPGLKRYHLLLTNLELVAVFFIYNIFFR